MAYLSQGDEIFGDYEMVITQKLNADIMLEMSKCSWELYAKNKLKLYNVQFSNAFWYLPPWGQKCSFKVMAIFFHAKMLFGFCSQIFESPNLKRLFSTKFNPTISSNLYHQPNDEVQIILVLYVANSTSMREVFANIWHVIRKWPHNCLLHWGCGHVLCALLFSLTKMVSKEAVLCSDTISQWRG